MYACFCAKAAPLTLVEAVISALSKLFCLSKHHVNIYHHITIMLQPRYEQGHALVSFERGNNCNSPSCLSFLYLDRARQREEKVRYSNRDALGVA